MAKRIQLQETALFFKEQDNILILSHQSPDGDTMGSAFALHLALTQMGKNVRLECADGFPERFCLSPLPQFSDFEPNVVVAVDVADTKLLGNGLQQYADRIDLCIDHHPTNTGYADLLLLKEDAGSTCEIIYRLLQKMDAEITPSIASYLYMGLSTDTGCFKFSNTTADTHRIAAELMELGADYIPINVRFFNTKSKSRILVERQALDSIRFFFEEKSQIRCVDVVPVAKIFDGYII